MSETPTCGHDDLYYKLTHKGRKDLFEDLEMFVCSSCVDKNPFNALPREPLTK